MQILEALRAPTDTFVPCPLGGLWHCGTASNKAVTWWIPQGDMKGLTGVGRPGS